MEKKTNNNTVIEAIKKEIILSAGMAFGNFFRDIGNKLCEVMLDELKKTREMGSSDNNKIQGQ